MSTSAARVASRFLHASDLAPFVEALRPIYTGDPDDLDMFAESVIDHIRSGLRETAKKLFQPEKFKVTFGPRSSQEDTFYHSGSGRREFSYWYRVEYPTSLTLASKFRVDMARRWNEAVLAHKNKTNGNLKAVRLNSKALSFFSDLLTEAIEDSLPGTLSAEQNETLVDKMFADPFKGADTDASMSESSDSGEEDEDFHESPSVDARFIFQVDKARAKLTSTLHAHEGQILLDLEVPVQVILRKVVSPWDSKYMDYR